MSEKSVGINTRNADAYVAAFEAAEQADGYTRNIQIVGLTAGKIDQNLGDPDKIVSSNDSNNITTITGSIETGDNAYCAIYPRHSQSAGSCVVTPLLCDNQGTVVGMLDSKYSNVPITMYSGSDYISKPLIWDIKSTGAWKIYVHISELSDSNTVKLWIYTF
jgi:hypothetical protein